MDIEYAKVMTSEESKRFFDSIKNRSIQENINKDKILLQHKERLIDEYSIASSNIEKKYYLEMIDHEAKLLAKKNNKCICGGEVVVKNGQFGQFKSCKNYFDKSKDHWVGKVYDLYEPKHRVDTNYLTNIIRKIGLRGKLTAKKLLEFYESNDMKCLREVYGYGNSRNHIDTLTDTRKKASEFEGKMTSELSKKYPVCIPQLGITYRLKGDTKIKRCFLDILCSNDKEVIIYECKTHKMYEDDEQKNLYLSLINFIENKGRKVSFKYLIEQE